MVVLLALVMSSADEHYRKGVDLFGRGEVEAAVTPFQEAVKLAPENAQMWKALGVALAAQERYNEAEPAFSRACKLEPKLDDACYFFGRALYVLNRFEAALPALQQALPVDRRPWRVHAAMGQAHEALGHTTEAEDCFTAAMKLHERATPEQRGRPDDDPRVPYAVFLFRQGRMAQAVKPLEDATREHPRAPRPHYELGRVRYQLNELDEAITHLRLAAELGYGSAAHLLLSKAYQRIGNADAAERHLRMATQARR